MGIPTEIRRQISRWIDRRDKMSPTEWEMYGLEIGVTQPQLTGVKEMLQNEKLWKKSPELVRLFPALKAMGGLDYIKYNPAVIRGLDYYTGVVWEAFDISGDIPRAIMGGGRYNNLLGDVGGEPLPATGFAMGDVVLTLILENKGLMPADLKKSPAAVLVSVFDSDRYMTSLEFAAELRNAGINVCSYPEVAKLPKQFKYADRMGIATVTVIGPDEAATNQVTIKNLSNGNQQTVSRKDAIKILKHILE